MYRQWYPPVLKAVLRCRGRCPLPCAILQKAGLLDVGLDLVAWGLRLFFDFAVSAFSLRFLLRGVF